MLIVDRSGYISLAGRFLLASIFLLSAANKIMNPQATQQFMAEHGMSATGFFLVGAILLELTGGLSLLFGFWTRIGAMLLTFFMIPTTLIFHTNFNDPTQVIMFLKNLAMMGGLLYVYVYGPGLISVDARQMEVEPAVIVERDRYRRTG